MICSLCPRHCRAERTEESGQGYCRMPASPVVARAALHFWEEPCISGTKGSGAIFFSGCNLGCVFCQNTPISHENFGKPVTVGRLREMMTELIAQGAHNINLVSPDIYTPWICEALSEPLPVPVVWNSGGYCSVETLRTLEGKVSVFLPDLKYMDEDLARKYSMAPEYPERAKEAIREMFRQVGPYRIGEDGLLQSGMVLRHLMLPGAVENTKRVIDWVAEEFRPGDILFSLMNQYTPQPGMEGDLNRRVRKAEYRLACNYMRDCGIEDGFTQQAESASSDYTPAFDLTGV